MKPLSLEYLPAIYRALDEYFDEVHYPLAGAKRFIKYASNVGDKRVAELSVSYFTGVEVYYKEESPRTPDNLNYAKELLERHLSEARCGAEFVALKILSMLGFDKDSYLDVYKEVDSWSYRYVHECFEAFIHLDRKKHIEENYIRIDNSQFTDQQYVELIQALVEKYDGKGFKCAVIDGLTYFIFTPNQQGAQHREVIEYMGSYRGEYLKPLELLKILKETSFTVC